MVSIAREPRPARPYIHARPEFPIRPIVSAARQVTGYLLLGVCLALPLIAALALRAYVFVPR
ncbi:hypothetical protein [Phreatobacter stygius]|uniref:Uncharacterized protein n=1 Tax=Phreatobacter stygius TaxID=1940610 RepID=A0A4D7BCJ2_9HYPH|nr:hypothetical protein [Phreatobacter stygius]QCI65742.1 hypothetical protein E8M01_16905 [Phreatobacter stygius]